MFDGVACFPGLEFVKGFSFGLDAQEAGDEKSERGAAGHYEHGPAEAQVLIGLHEGQSEGAFQERRDMPVSVVFAMVYLYSRGGRPLSVIRAEPLP